MGRGWSDRSLLFKGSEELLYFEDAEADEPKDLSSPFRLVSVGDHLITAELNVGFLCQIVVLSNYRWVD